MSTPSHKQGVLESKATVALHVCSLQSDGPLVEPNATLPPVIPYRAARAVLHWEEMAPSLWFQEDHEIITMIHDIKFTNLAIPADTTRLPSISENFPLPQLLCGFGSTINFVTKVLPAFASFFALSLLHLPLLIFACMDYEGDRNLNKVRYATMNENGSFKPDAASKLGGIPQSVLRLIPLIIQLGAAFHIQQPLLTFLYYNEIDSNSFGAHLLYRDGEVSKFGCRARESRKTRLTTLKKLLVPALRSKLKDMYATPEERKKVRLKGKSIDTADKKELIAMIVRLLEEKEQNKEDEEKDKKEGGKEEEGEKDRPDEDGTGEEGAEEDGAEENRGEEDGAEEEEGGEEDGTGDGSPGDSGDDPIVLDPDELRETSKMEEMLSLLNSAGEDERTLSAKVHLYEKIIELHSTVAWKGKHRVPMQAIRDRCYAFLALNASVTDDAGVPDVTAAENAADTAAQQSTVRRFGMMTGAETISYTRLLWRATVHFMAWLLIRPTIIVILRLHYEFADISDFEEREFIAAVTKRHQGVCNLFLFFDVYLDTAIGAFRRWSDGDFSALLNRFHIMAVDMVYAEKYLLAGCMFGMIDSLNHYILHHPSIFLYICRNSRKLYSDVQTELINSRFAGMINSGALQTDDYLITQSLLQVYPGRIRAWFRRFTGLFSERERQTSELERRHRRVQADKYNSSIVAVADIIKEQVLLLLDDHESVKHMNHGDSCRANRGKIAFNGKKGVPYTLKRLEVLLGGKEEEKPKPLTVKSIKEKCETLNALLDKEEDAADNTKFKENDEQPRKGAKRHFWFDYMGRLFKRRQKLEEKQRKERAQDARRVGRATRSGRYTTVTEEEEEEVE